MIDEYDIVKKALDCCINRNCSDCPYDELNISGQCMNALMHNARTVIEKYRIENEHLSDDIEHAMYNAMPKCSRTCNFCEHDSESSANGEGCKGKNDWVYCSPKWRGVGNIKEDC